MSKSTLSVIITDRTNAKIKIHLKDVDVAIVVWNYETRNSWGHKAKLWISYVPKGETEKRYYYVDSKITYYNRTWESYRFQSVISSALTKALKGIHEEGNTKLYKRIMKTVDRLGRKAL